MLEKSDSDSNCTNSVESYYSCELPTIKGESSSPCIPDWVKYLGGPVWVSSSDSRISYINDEALQLLGISREDCLGRACHEVIGSCDEERRPFCSENCLMRQLVRSHSQIKPMKLEVTSASGERHWLRLVVIPVKDALSGGTCLVHCAIDDDRAHAIEQYLERVTKRTAYHSTEVDSSHRFKLTKREKQILELLTEDETLWSIAHELNVSYATVRNHVHHILVKLGVHSIIEAVAFHLVGQKHDT